MSENKTLKINPDLFKLKKNKVKNKTENKPKIDKQQNKSANKIKHELLKRVKEYQKNQDNNPSLNICDTNINSTFENSFEKEFNNSLQFLQKISNNSKKKSLKQKRDNPVLHVDTNPPKDLDNDIVYKTNTPKFSCLKNGTLPLYSTQTLKNNIKKNVKLNIEPIIEPVSSSTTIKAEILTPEKIDITPVTSANTLQEPPKINVSLPPVVPPIQHDVEPTIVQIHSEPIKSCEIVDDKNEDIVTNIINNNSLLQNSTTLNQEKEKERKEEREKIDDKIPKIRRCTRHYTYKLGKVNNRVGVLIKSRDTIKRNNKNISDIKSTSIQDIKQYLRDNNLIKLGSSAPPDVLKKMYESSLLSGDINNINKDNIIHNYLNS
jgi:hypothetical protein